MIIEWTKKVKENSIVIVKSRKELEKEFGGIGGLVPGHFYTIMLDYCGKRFRLTPEQVDLLSSGRENRFPVLERGGCMFYVSMLKLASRRTKEEIAEDEKINKERESLNKYSLVIKKKDPSIIKKMVSLVDMDIVYKLFSIGAMSKDINKSFVDEYIQRWAVAKYEYFVMFGEKLKISKFMDFKIEDKDMNKMVKDLGDRYIAYAPILNSFSAKDFSDNKCPKNEAMSTYFKDKYVEGMKLSKFISRLLSDDKFDIELSKILQNRYVKGSMSVSIDPVDILTMAIHKHGWASCYHLNDGCYSNGAFSVLVDEHELVAYKENGLVYDYDIRGHVFKWNSKQVRQNIFVDKGTCSIGFCNPQGSPSNEVLDTLSGLIKNSISEYLDKEIEWISPRNLKHYDNCRHHHLAGDVRTTIAPKESSSVTQRIGIGEFNLKCPICGKIIDKDYNSILKCDDCRKKLPS